MAFVLPSQDIPVKISTAILALLAYSLLLHGLIYVPMLFGRSIVYSYAYPDIEIYSIWAKNFSEQLLGGEILPRWLTNLNDGMGQPTFFFYPPLVFYVGTLFYIPELLAVAPYFQIQTLALLGTFLSGVTFYFWIGRYTARYIAVISAMIYSSFHYHFNVDVLLRQAIAEQWAFVWMPLILMATDNLFEKRRFQVPFLALAYFLLLVTHLISSLIFSTALGIYFLFRLNCTEDRVSVLCKFSAGILLGIAMAALLILPILELRPFVNMYIFTTGSWSYKTQFLLTDSASSQDLPTDFWLIIGPVLCWMFYKDSIDSGKLWGHARQVMLAMLCINIFTSFMVTLPSKPIWDAVPILQMVQFPWRFLILQVLSVSLAFGIYIQITRKRSEILLVMFFIGAFIYSVLPDKMIDLGNTNNPRSLSSEQKHQFAVSKKEWRERSFDLLAALNPSTSCQNAKSPPILSECVIGIFDRGLSRSFLVSNNGIFNLIQNHPRQVEIGYEVSKPAALTVKRAYFHGNVASADTGQEILLSHNKDGLITMIVPEGKGVITINLPYFASEKIGGLISLVSFVILGMMFAFQLPRKHNANV